MNNSKEAQIVIHGGQSAGALSSPVSSAALAAIAPPAQALLSRMFADPYLLDKDQRAELVTEMRQAVAKYPKVSELRVLLGMSLCVNLEIQDAMEELGEAVALDPHSFIAHFKMGELWTRLRVMNKAEDHTRQAANLAQNMAQSEMARRQAATIRSMKQGGIERGGYRGGWGLFAGLRRLVTRNRSEALTAFDSN